MPYWRAFRGFAFKKVSPTSATVSPTSANKKPTSANKKPTSANYSKVAGRSCPFISGSLNGLFLSPL